jgi:hypothetical protein
VIAYIQLGSGLFPFNPGSVLADTPKPPKLPSELTLSVEVESCPPYKALPTPVTPVSADALSSLLNIIKQVPDDETYRKHKEKLQQKVNNASQTFLAKNALLQARNLDLTAINDEGKVRRSTKSEILGKAKVMSYEDIGKARAERAAKEAAKEAKKAEQQAKTAAKEAEEPTAGKRRSRKRKS